MCNAYSHSPHCNCGWGGESYFGFYDSNNSCNTPKYATKGWFSDIFTEQITFKTSCYWCFSPVFFHRNANGGCVLFDDLGSPWQVHSCWETHKKHRAKAENRICIKFRDSHVHTESHKMFLSESERKTVHGYLYSVGKSIAINSESYFLEIFLKNDTHGYYRLLLPQSFFNKLKAYSFFSAIGKVAKVDSELFLIPYNIRASSQSKRSTFIFTKLIVQT